MGRFYSVNRAVLAAFLAIPFIAAAQPGPGEPLSPDPFTRAFFIAPPAGDGAGPQDPAELEAFLDGLMHAHLDTLHLAGAVVTVVKDSEVFFAKGYGYADVEEKIEVNPNTTLFRIGSVSKLFVWTAIMQLVEEGKLDLEADVNTYLTTFKIPPKYDQPITMVHLMTHTPGFEDNPIALFARSEDKLEPLGELLARTIPRRVRPPGVVASYSNYGTALAGHIIEEISGMSFDDYVEENIFKPLNMPYTTFRQPVPDHLAEQLSKGYRWEGGEFAEEGFEFVPIAPAGSVSSSAADMANFMIAHLQLGRFEDTRILQEDTAKRMQQDLFRHDPAVNPAAHGFMVFNRNNERIIGHGGDTLWFHSLWAMLPERNLGFYVSYNSAEGGSATMKFAEAFLDRYFPVDDPPELTPPADFAQRAQRYTGWYRVNRFSHSNLSKLGAAMGYVRVHATDDGALKTTVTGPTRWIEVEPHVFREAGGHDRLAFRQEPSGEVSTMFLGIAQVVAFERVPLLGHPFLNLAVLIGSVVLFLTAFFLWPYGAYLNRRFAYEPGQFRVLPVGARIAAWLAAAMFLAFIVVFGLVMADPLEIIFGVPPILETGLFFPLLGALFTILAIGYTIAIWKNAHGSPWRRIHYTLVTAACVAFLIQLYYWNLLGFWY